MIIDNTPIKQPTQSVTFGSIPPSSANIGDLFFKTTNRTLLVFNGIDWNQLVDERRLVEFKTQFDALLVDIQKCNENCSSVENQTLQNLQQHSDDLTKHLTPQMLNFLNGINGVSNSTLIFAFMVTMKAEFGPFF